MYSISQTKIDRNVFYIQFLNQQNRYGKKKGTGGGNKEYIYLAV